MMLGEEDYLCMGHWYPLVPAIMLGYRKMTKKQVYLGFMNKIGAESRFEKNCLDTVIFFPKKKRKQK
jgi:hypothetical protein